MRLIGYTSDSLADVAFVVKPKPSSRLSKVYARSHGVCQLCRVFCELTDASIDHIKPSARGGGNGFKNLQLAHKWCNEIKSCHVQRAPNFYRNHVKYQVK